MAKKRIARKDRKAKNRRNIKIEVNSNISKKDMEDLQKFKCTVKENVNCGSGSCFYFLGFIGALVYYISTAPDIWAAIIGFFKALLWPAFLVYEALLFMGM